jgi:hypothetical protein
VLDGENGWASDPGHLANVDEFSIALVRIICMFD